MKKLILYISVITFISCGITEAKKYFIYYSIQNKTTKSIKLKFYLTSNNQLSNEILINKNETFNNEELESYNPYSNEPNNSEPRELGRGSDSLVVIYNNERKSIFLIDYNGNFSAPINRNPFRHGNYDNLGNDKFQFTFTEEDYNNAIDCNGNCD